MGKSPSKIKSFRAVIELWLPPSGVRSAAFSAFVKALAEELPDGVAPPSEASAAKYWQRDNLPAEWWSATLKTPVARRAGLTSDLFVELASERLAECA